MILKKKKGSMIINKTKYEFQMTNAGVTCTKARSRMIPR